MCQSQNHRVSTFRPSVLKDDAKKNPSQINFLKVYLLLEHLGDSVKCLTSAQVMISQLVGLSPALGSVLTAQSLEAALDSVSPSLSAPPLLTVCLSLSKINKYEKIVLKKQMY